MKEKFCILSFGPDYWDGPRHNRHYYCEALSRHVKILFVSPPFYIVRILREIFKGTLNKSGLRKVNDNLFNYSPSKFLFMIYRYRWLDRFLKNLRIRKIKKIMRRMGMEKPVLLIWHPAFLDMIGKFDESLVIYYVYDNISGYVGGSGQKSDNELQLLRSADIIFTLSQELYKENKKWAKEIYHMPNAVDFDLFSQARLAETTIPYEMTTIPKPRIGYIGTINEKVDIELLEYIADTRPDWSIVLIGRENYQTHSAKEKFIAFTMRENVYRFNYVEYNHVPEYLKALDICMMCYIINDWTYYGDPSKMHEYLASGKPTIAVALPAIKEFENVIAIPTSREGWVSAIENGLAETDEKMCEERIRVAYENSYTERAARTIGIIESKLFPQQ